MATGVTFVVEEAGCASCAERIRAALATAGVVDDITIDEAGDTATVRMSGHPAQDAVVGALDHSSTGSGHSYRLRPGSWRSA